MAIPGVPALAAGVVIDTIELIVADVLGLFPIASQQQWGLFLDGQPVVVADNVVSFEFKQDRRISNYPVEGGGFETYNKVAVPYDVRLRFSTGGSTADRQEMQDSIDAIMDSLESFDAVTPTKTYQSINPVHQDLRQTARAGVGLLVIDVFFEQIRVTATPQFTNSTASSSGTSVTGPGNITSSPIGAINQPQSPSASPQVSGGTVQSVPATSSQQETFTNALSIAGNPL